MRLRCVFFLMVGVVGCGSTGLNIDGQGQNDAAQRANAQEVQLQSMGYTLSGSSGPGSMTFDNTAFYTEGQTDFPADSLGSFSVTVNHALFEQGDGTAYVAPYQSGRDNGDFVNLVVNGNGVYGWVVVGKDVVQPGATINLGSNGVFAVFQWKADDGTDVYAMSITGTLTVLDGRAEVGSRLNAELLALFTPVVVAQPAPDNAALVQSMGYTVIGETGHGTVDFQQAYVYAPATQGQQLYGFGALQINLEGADYNREGAAWAAAIDGNDDYVDMFSAAFAQNEYVSLFVPRSFLQPGLASPLGPQTAYAVFYYVNGNGQQAEAVSVTGTLTVSEGGEAGSRVTATLVADFTPISIEQPQPQLAPIDPGTYSLTIDGAAVPGSVSCGGTLQGSEAQFAQVAASSVMVTGAFSVTISGGDAPQVNGDYITANFGVEALPLQSNNNGWYVFGGAAASQPDFMLAARFLFLVPENGQVTSLVGAEVVPTGATDDSNYCFLYFPSTFALTTAPVTR
jgi:hypothetical protein